MFLLKIQRDLCHLKSFGTLEKWAAGSISTLGVICGLSLLVLNSDLRGFSLGTVVFSSHQKSFDLIC